MSKERLPDKKEEIPIMPFESLPPITSEEVLKEMQRRGLRPATFEEIANFGAGTKYLTFENGEWQLREKPEQKKNKK